MIFIRQILLFFLLCITVQTSQAEPLGKKADYTITWTGSAFKDGDAFTVKATVFKSRVDRVAGL